MERYKMLLLLLTGLLWKVIESKLASRVLSNHPILRTREGDEL
jgi:hypothetical protein